MFRRSESGFLTALVAALFLLLSAFQASAGVCEALGAQLRATTQNSATLQLNRQLAALRSLERQRNCTKQGVFGFFTACGDISRRKSDVQSAIQSARPSGNANAIRARMASLGCTVEGTKRKQERTASNLGTLKAAGKWVSGSDMLFCVRPSDGYYFPAPNSQFVEASSYKLVLSQCQYICDDADMQVYLLDRGSLETEEMISASTRASYRDLPTAFKYRESANFQSCNLQRYNQRVAAARAQARTPSNINAKEVVLPIPEARPEIDPIMAYGEQEKPKLLPQFDRKVRVVGSPYLPTDE